MRNNTLYVFALLAILVDKPLLAESVVSPNPAIVELDLSPQPLSDALHEFCDRSDISVLYNPELVRGVYTDTLKVTASVDQVLVQLLTGTGLEHRYLNERTVTLVPVTDRELTSGSRSTEIHVRPPINGNTVSQGKTEDAVSQSNNDRSTTSEVVVTGTKLRGATPISPLLVIDSADIQASGYSNAGEVLRSLPQNFSGGINPGVVGAPGFDNSANNAASASPNLRGLGADSTLTLVNGRRVASAGLSGAPDISPIALNAVDRIEVLSDGASATYGSDAVAGVVNFILKKDYHGGLTSARIGHATNGGATTRQFSQLLGRSWSSGGVLVSYEYDEQGALYSDERSFSSAAEPPNSLLPMLSRHSAFAYGHQNITNRVSIFAQGLYTSRTADYVSTTLGTSVFAHVPVEEHGITVGIDAELPRLWKFSAAGSLSENTERVTSRTITSGVSTERAPSEYFNRLVAFDLQSEGPVLYLPGGAVRMAIGAGHRRESLDVTAALASSREVTYAYSEVRVPVVGPAQDVSGIHNLEISFAGRYETYTDFGHSATPKLGFLYAPTSTVQIRASWGKSFRAPSLMDEYGRKDVLLLPASFFPSVTTPDSAVMLHTGGNPDLRPETSKSWTVGLHLSPQMLPDFKASATYYRLSAHDRILSQPISNVIAALSDPASADFVTFAPSPGLQKNRLAGATFTPFVPYDPENVFALIENQAANAETQQVYGVDVAIAYTNKELYGNPTFRSDMTWIQLQRKLTPNAPTSLLSGHVFNPPEYKLRAGVSWRPGTWELNGFLNYISSVKDFSQQIISGAGGWTTVDLNVGYRFAEASGAAGLRVSIAAQNVFDRKPIPLRSGATTIPGLGYDSTNSSPLGRFLTFALSQAW